MFYVDDCKRLYRSCNSAVRYQYQELRSKGRAIQGVSHQMDLGVVAVEVLTWSFHFSNLVKQTNSSSFLQQFSNL